MSPPEWAPQAVEPHPGREEWEVGVSTIVSRPERVYQRIQGGKPPEVRQTGAMLLGSCAHKVLLSEAPIGEPWLRLRVDGTSYYVGGHPDVVERDGRLTDLKTTNLFSVDDGKLAEWVDQALLYAYVWNHGEVNVGTRKEPDWRPCAGIYGFEVEEVAIALVSPETESDHPEDLAVDWEYEVVDGEDFQARTAAVWHHARSTVREMVANAWEPPEGEADEGDAPLRPEDVDEDLTSVMRTLAAAKEAKEDADETYDDYRKRVEALTPPGVTLKAHGITASHVEPSTKQVLDMETVEEALAETDKDLDDFEERVTSTELNEDKLKAFLAEQGYEEEEVTREKQTRAGYVQVS